VEYNDNINIYYL